MLSEYSQAGFDWAVAALMSWNPKDADRPPPRAPMSAAALANRAARLEKLRVKVNERTGKIIDVESDHEFA